MEWNKKFLLTNKSRGEVTINSMKLVAGESVPVNPNLYSASAIEQMRLFHERGVLLATNDFVDDEEDVTTNNADVEKVSTENHEHVVFTPQDFKKTAIDVKPISSEGKAIEVQEVDTQKAKAVEVRNDEAVEEAEARNFMAQHWRKIEAEMKKITDLDKLELLLRVAMEMELGGKKIDLIKERITELNK